MTVRAKFLCNGKDQSHAGPIKSTRYRGGDTAPQEVVVFPRTFRFQAVTNDGQPENERFHSATPYGKVEINVDNPDVDFELGTYYYLDFTPVDEASA